MAWTLNGNRPRDPRSRRPHLELEQLDERQLLSAGLGTSLPNPGAVKHLDAAHRSRIVAAHATTPIKVNLNANVNAKANLNAARVSAATARLGAANAFASRASALQKASLARTTETPAGTIAAGTPTVFDPIIGAAQTRQTYKIDGSGMTVAVIDTGVDYNNKALGGGFGANSRVVAGYNFATGSGDPIATTSQHGTGVAGLIAGSDPDHLGVAPGVDVVALKVTGDNDVAQLSSIASALQWVVDHHSEYNITVVNMSLSNGKNYTSNWLGQDARSGGKQITDLVQTLKGMNIAVVAATGNSFDGQQGEGFTSIVDGVISVTATDSNDKLLPNAQRLGAEVGGSTATDIAAPGAGIVAPWGDNGYLAVDGTSFAAPLVSGSVVLLQQLYMSRFNTLPTVDQITTWLKQGATPIYDSVTGITLGRLDLAKSASLVPGGSTTPPTTPVVTPPTTQPPVVTVPTTPVVTVPTTPTTPTTPVVTVPTTPTTPVVTPPTTPVVTPPTTPVVTPPAEQTLDLMLILNGKALSSNDTAQAASTSKLGRSGLGQLVQAMNRWANSPDGTKTVGRVRAWNATSN
jgi:subtilisin family serine protease